MANSTPGERASNRNSPSLGPPMKIIFLAPLEKSSCVPHITSVMSTIGLGQEVNKVRERLAHLDVPAELMRPLPLPPFKASGSLLPAHSTPCFIHTETRIPAEGSWRGGEKKQNTSVFRRELIRYMTRLW